MDILEILFLIQRFMPFIKARYSASLFVLTPIFSEKENRVLSLSLITPPIPALIGL